MSENSKMFDETKHSKTEEHDWTYFLGVFIALSSAFSGGLFNVMVSGLKSVPSFVLVFYSGIGSLLIVFISTAVDPNTMIFSATKIYQISLTNWLVMIG